MKIYMLSTVGLRWINRRGRLLQGREPTAADKAALANIDVILRQVGALRMMGKHADNLQEIQSMTDIFIFNNLRNTDHSSGKWVAEDPSLAQIQHVIQTEEQPIVGSSD